MNKWFEVKVKYEKIGEGGKNKVVSENYLFDAVSFTEAETRTIEEIKPYVQGELKVATIKESNIVELFPYSTGDIWFKVSVDMVTLDEEAGKENKTKLHYLVLADDVQQALIRFSKNLDQTIVPYLITLITTTSIIDIYPYNNKEDENKKPD